MSRNFHEETDEALIKQAIQDKSRGKGQVEAEAFTVLMDRYRRKIEGVARKYGPSSDVEDVLQEVYINTWNSLEHLKKPGSFGAWLRRTAQNKAVDHLRQKTRGIELISYDSPNQKLLEELGIYGTETGIEAKEYIQRVLDSLLNELSKKHYLCYILKAYGYSTEEIAEHLELKKDSVTVYCSTATRKVNEIRERMLQEQERGLL